MVNRLRYGFNNILNDDLSLPSYMNKINPSEQLNLIGYSYGSLVAADVASYYAKNNVKVDNLVLIGSPISSGYLNDLLRILAKLQL